MAGCDNRQVKHNALASIVVFHTRRQRAREDPFRLISARTLTISRSPPIFEFVARRRHAKASA